MGLEKRAVIRDGIRRNYMRRYVRAFLRAMPAKFKHGYSTQLFYSEEHGLCCGFVLHNAAANEKRGTA